MSIPKIEQWGEHYPCMSYETLRIPFEDWMKSEYSQPNLEWNNLCNFYQDPQTELRFQGFCEGALFMEYYKMPKHERSEYMKGVLFAEDQKEIGWVFKSCNYEEQSLTWEYVHKNGAAGEEKPRQVVFAENEFFDGVIDYQKHMERL